ncbi:UNVERIFIED_CONTAM: hypothetical protein Sangu_2639200 [Sesamum angustifolium]|uniref:Uncharacterized protein n=1 Tax=Sesamum angustifolium TaxID=2727405 RepID=A0AAW2J3Y2_9LAMI
MAAAAPDAAQTLGDLVVAPLKEKRATKRRRRGVAQPRRRPSATKTGDGEASPRSGRPRRRPSIWATEVV